MLLVLTPESILNAGNGEPTEKFYPTSEFRGSTDVTPRVSATMSDDGSQKVVTLQGYVEVSMYRFSSSSETYTVTLPNEIHPSNKQNLAATFEILNQKYGEELDMEQCYVSGSRMTFTFTRTGLNEVTGTVHINVDGLRYLAA